MAGVRIEGITIFWMLIEAMVAIGGGILARSVLLTAFGIDSVIELVTGGILFWRLLVEARRGSVGRVELAERRAAWVTGSALALLCVYIIVSAGYALVTQAQPETSYAGIGLAIVALGIMPVLAHRKRVIADRIASASLRGDAACSITCAYMAATLLIGLVVNAVFGWWWADSLATLALLFFLIPETREVLEHARAGRAGCSCSDDECSS
jgi:divalent metal cation (Fe/Co/Zn/Cd) transporter